MSELRIMDESWMKELNARNLLGQDEDCSTWELATVIISFSVLEKLSKEEQAKFQMTEFKRATNEIEYWSRVEEICDFFGVEDPNYAGEIYTRQFKNFTYEDETQWMALRDISEDRPEGFGVKVDWG